MTFGTRSVTVWTAVCSLALVCSGCGTYWKSKLKDEACAARFTAEVCSAVEDPQAAFSGNEDLGKGKSALKALLTDERIYCVQPATEQDGAVGESMTVDHASKSGQICYSLRHGAELLSTKTEAVGEAFFCALSNVKQTDPAICGDQGTVGKQAPDRCQRYQELLSDALDRLAEQLKGGQPDVSRKAWQEMRKKNYDRRIENCKPKNDLSAKDDLLAETATDELRQPDARLVDTLRAMTTLISKVTQLLSESREFLSWGQASIAKIRSIKSIDGSCKAANRKCGGQIAIEFVQFQDEFANRTSTLIADLEDLDTYLKSPALTFHLASHPQLAELRDYLDTLKFSIRDTLTRLAQSEEIRNVLGEQVRDVSTKMGTRLLLSMEVRANQLEKALDKLDERLYGLVSVSLLFIEESLQEKTDEVLISVVEEFTRKDKDIELGLARAACEYLGVERNNDYRRSGVLVPLVARSLVNVSCSAIKVGASDTFKDTFVAACSDTKDQKKGGRTKRVLTAFCSDRSSAKQTTEQPLRQIIETYLKNPGTSLTVDTYLRAETALRGEALRRGSYLGLDAAKERTGELLAEVARTRASGEPLGDALIQEIADANGRNSPAIARVLDRPYTTVDSPGVLLSIRDRPPSQGTHPKDIPVPPVTLTAGQPKLEIKVPIPEVKAHWVDGNRARQPIMVELESLRVSPLLVPVQSPAVGYNVGKPLVSVNLASDEIIGGPIIKASVSVPSPQIDVTIGKPAVSVNPERIEIRTQGPDIYVNSGDPKLTVAPPKQASVTAAGPDIYVNSGDPKLTVAPPKQASVTAAGPDIYVNSGDPKLTVAPPKQASVTAAGPDIYVNSGDPKLTVAPPKQASVTAAGPDIYVNSGDPKLTVAPPKQASVTAAGPDIYVTPGDPKITVKDPNKLCAFTPAPNHCAPGSDRPTTQKLDRELGRFVCNEIRTIGTEDVRCYLASDTGAISLEIKALPSANAANSTSSKSMQILYEALQKAKINHTLQTGICIDFVGRTSPAPVACKEVGSKLATTPPRVGSSAVACGQMLGLDRSRETCTDPYGNEFLAKMRAYEAARNFCDHTDGGDTWLSAVFATPYPSAPEPSLDDEFSRRVVAVVSACPLTGVPRLENALH